MSKPRANLRLLAKMHAELSRRSEAYGLTKTTILEAALEHYFDAEGASRLEDRVLRRLDQIGERLNSVERDISLSLEAFRQYVFHWLARTDSLPEGERETAQALAERRFEFFIRQVSQQLISDSRWDRVDEAIG